MTQELSLAEKLFDADVSVFKAEDELFDLLEAIGLGESWADWGRDQYDESLELYGVPPDVRLTKEQQAKFKEVGFSIVYLNHTDGMETHYSLHRGSEWRPEWAKDRPKREQADSTVKELRRKVRSLSCAS